MKWLYVFLFILFASCSRHSAVPEKYIGFDSMRSIVWDLARADQYAVGYLVRDTTRTLRQHTDSIYQLVFKLHHINRNRFYESLDYYQSNPKLNKELMDSVYAIGDRERSKSSPGKPSYVK
ncbi:MAG: hypothetical protein JWN76_342 [Chitinophagaceae bacterium]|nr:hypothetical protein [Chitinophagaceae bacterium]